MRTADTMCIYPDKSLPYAKTLKKIKNLFRSVWEVNENYTRIQLNGLSLSSWFLAQILDSQDFSNKWLHAINLFNPTNAENASIA